MALLILASLIFAPALAGCRAWSNALDEIGLGDDPRVPEAPSADTDGDGLPNGDGIPNETDGKPDGSENDGALSVTFTGLSADGAENTVTTGLLTLSFSRDIPNLSAADITIVPGITGTSKNGRSAGRGRESTRFR